MSNRFADGIAGFAAWIASLLGPRAMRVIAKVNKRVTNPVQRLWAPRLRYMAVIEHTGRKSGNTYRTIGFATFDRGLGRRSSSGQALPADRPPRHPH